MGHKINPSMLLAKWRVDLDHCCQQYCFESS